MHNGSGLDSVALNELRDAVTKACGDAVNMHYTDPVWLKLADVFDWQGRWPVIQKDGLLTGEVFSPEDGLLHTYDSDAVIRREDAIAGGWAIDEESFAHPPSDRLASTAGGE